MKLHERAGIVTLGRKDRAGSPLDSLSVLIPLDEQGKPRTEVRLFKVGINPTENGDYLFDAAEAAATMAAYAKHGVDVMVDLEHLSLDPDAPNYDPDARGRGKLELRNGELWLCSIKWTPDAVDRITTGKQIYVSPAFPRDPQGRVLKIINVALTAMPATDDAMPLAASVRHEGNDKMDPKLLAEKVKLFVQALKQGTSHADIVKLAATDMKTLQAVVKALGGDPTADLGTLFGIVQDFAKSLTDMASGKPVDKPADKPADGAPADGAPMMNRAKPEELETLRLREAARVESDRKELETLRRRDAERDATERHELTAALVHGGFVPADVWADDDAKKPQAWIVAMPIEQLRAMAKRHGGQRPATGQNARPPAGEGAPATCAQIVEVSEYEQNRVRATVPRENPTATADQLKRLEDKALLRYATDGPKVQQTLGAGKDREKAQRLSRKLEQTDVMANRLGVFGHSELVRLTSAELPISQFGQSSQRALEEFRLEYNATVVSQPVPWSETIGSVLPSGSLVDTYPISFNRIAYAERKGQAAPASTPQSADLTVKKRIFEASAQANLDRLQRCDFAYVQQWQQNAANLARARIALKNELVVVLLEAGTTGYWGKNAEFSTGFDGQPFFSATHKVHPFNDKVTFLGSATWGNYQSAATPLNAGNLTQEKAAMVLVPAFDGRAMNSEASGLLIPLRLKEPSRLLLTVQDLILAADVQTSGSGKMGQVRNEHFGSGLERTVGAELAGTSVAANYYLYDLVLISKGLPPWVISEDAQERLTIWDENSDFCKDTKQIKIESSLFINALLMFPHGIRYIKGS